MERIWFLVVVVGPVLLLAALIWAYFRNRNASPASFARSEEGAKQLREDIRNDPEYRQD
jgi:hypothetical protein